MSAGMKGLEERLRGISIDNRDTLHPITLTAITEAADRIATLEAAMPDLSSVVGWLANGCDVTHAVTELRIYQARIDRAALAAGEG